MADIGHFGNYLFNHLAYNIAQYMVFRVIGVKEFISNVVLLIYSMFDLQIKYGR